MRDDAFRGPAAVTCVYFMLYLGFMILQRKTRGAAVDRARAQGTEVPAGKSFADSVANDPGALNSIRRRLHETRGTSRLFDTRRWVWDWERLIEAMLAGGG